MTDLQRSVSVFLVRALACWTVLACAQTAPARAQTAVSLELILAIDTSDSVDGIEFNLMRRGMAAAFRRPEIIQLIELQNGVAVAVFQWNSDVDSRYMTRWHLLRTKSDCLAFAALVERIDRNPYRGFTAIGEALAFGIHQLETNDFQGQRLKIDVAGDGRSNRGLDPAIARQAAGHKGIQINGLPIITTTNTGNRDLDRYYLHQVIQGPGAFVEIATGFSDFTRAFRRKLLREITPAISQRDGKSGGEPQFT